jgi:hypothetical protein
MPGQKHLQEVVNSLRGVKNDLNQVREDIKRYRT